MLEELQSKIEASHSTTRQVCQNDIERMKLYRRCVGRN